MTSSGRRALALLILPALAACSGSARREATPSGARPRNLLLLTLDTTRRDHLGAYGRKGDVSPNLDALAKRGARFEQAVTPLALTRPAHATLLTGLLPQRHGVWSNGPYRLDPKWPTLARRFKDAGFHTGAVVSSFVLGGSFGLAQGFDRYDDATHEVEGGDPEKKADEVVRSAEGLLQGPLESPFFLWLHFYDPHYPYEPPPPFAQTFAADPYDGEIATMDAAIGRVLKRLASDGRLAATLVVAVADHGESLGEHHEETHGYLLYDATMRVPLVMAGPGVPAGAVVEEQVTLADLAPTLLHAFSLLRPDEDVDGRSFWTALASGRVADRPALLENRTIHNQFGWAMLSGVRAEGWKWLRAPAPELYDLARDPGETRNLADEQPARAAKLQDLWARLQPKAEAASPSAGAGLSPEEEEKLASLGYVSAGGGGSTADLASGPDPKTIAPVLGRLEELVRLRRAGPGPETTAAAEAVLAGDPTNRFALRVRAEHLLESGRFAEARPILESLAAGDDAHPETLALLARAYEGGGDRDKAVALLQRATTPPWLHWPALESLARLVAASPARGARDDLLRKLAGLRPRSYRETLAVARADAILGAHGEALAAFRTAGVLQPGGTEALVGAAQMLVAQGDTAQALATLSRVDPATVESLFVTGIALTAGGRKGEGCATLRQAAGLEAKNRNLLFGLGARLADCGDLETAGAAFDRLLGLYPGDAEAVFRLAQVEERRGHSSRARVLYGRFLATAPDRLAAEKAAAQARVKALGS